VGCCFGARRERLRRQAYGKLMAADILILAGSVQDRYLSARWKIFFDRGFFMNHVPLFAGKQIGCLVSGPLAQLANLRQILEAYFECQQANFVGIVTDECVSSEELDRLLDGLAGRLSHPNHPFSPRRGSVSSHYKRATFRNRN
jgi:hypothetical protein